MCYIVSKSMRLPSIRARKGSDLGTKLVNYALATLRTAPPISPMPDGAAAALNAESCVSSRPHVTADVMTRGPARRARGDAT